MAYSPFDVFKNYNPQTPINLICLSTPPSIPYSYTDLDIIPSNIIAPAPITMEDGPTVFQPYAVSFTASAEITLLINRVPYYVAGWALVQTIDNIPQLLFAGPFTPTMVLSYQGEQIIIRITGQYQIQRVGQ